jgi:UDP-2,4-diacetamido-2,4,6-trideoxy-beta-L-altropyranose hydrolase
MENLNSEHLILRADASAQIGSGHLMRCLALAQAWKDAGGNVTFITACQGEGLLQRLRDEEFDIKLLSSAYPDIADWSFTRGMLSGYPCAWVVLDGYHFDEVYQRQVREAGHRLLVIDDMAHLKHYYADIVLNQNLHAEQLRYVCEPDTRLLLGTRYVLLRREFLAWKEWQREIPDEAHCVLVTLGGGDPENNTLKVVQALQEVDIPDLEATVVIGASNPHASVLEKAVRQSRFPLRLVSDTKNMPELMALADAAVSAGGSTAWELLFMGTPSLFLIVADNQRYTAEYIENRGFGENLGLAQNISTESLTKTITSLVNDFSLRATISRKSRQMVDGRGARRVINSMKSPSIDELKLRPATPEDFRLLWEWANEPSVRSASFSTELIPWEDHVNWFRRKVTEPDCHHYIFVLSGNDFPIGQVRFDSMGSEAEMHLSIASDLHGHGYGSQAILMASEQMFKETLITRIYANIKPDNSNSISAFTNAGFKLDGPVKEVKGHKAVQMVLDKSAGDS